MSNMCFSKFSASFLENSSLACVGHLTLSTPKSLWVPFIHARNILTNIAVDLLYITRLCSGYAFYHDGLSCVPDLIFGLWMSIPAIALELAACALSIASLFIEITFNITPNESLIIEQSILKTGPYDLACRDFGFYS